LLVRNLHLTYCTNIHPSDGWDAVSANLRKYAPPLKQRFSPDAPFGLGLRLSARDATELLQGNRLSEFRHWLDSEGLYVAIINGFPYGPFHGQPVKENVYAPDWRNDERVRYTLDLVRILKQLLPEGVEGGISTAPLSYKGWMLRATDEDWKTIVGNVVKVAEAMAGHRIHLDIEPEPDCVLENTAETVAFFRDRLFQAGDREMLSKHVQVCFDCCHFAVEFEDHVEALRQFAEAGIRIGRVQLSSAIHVDIPADGVSERLAKFVDSTYLHQVVEQRGGCLHHYPDLGPALPSVAKDGAKQWRIHFHVPLFTPAYDGLASTQSYVQSVIQTAIRQPFTQHLEIETYTWDVLPAGLKIDLLESIGREYEWVLGEMQ